MEQDDRYRRGDAVIGGRKFLVASKDGNGFVVAEDECVANTRKGKPVLNLKGDERAMRSVIAGELVASVGENRKMLIFRCRRAGDGARPRRASAALQGEGPLRHQL